MARAPVPVPALLTADDVREVLAARCRHAGSQAALARQADVSGQFVSDVLLGRREPSDRLLAALGLAAAGRRYVRTGETA